MIRAAVIALAVLLLAGPAHAADELTVSADGSAWTSSLPGPVLAEDGRWVPGDVRTGTFWVRNAANATGTLSVAARAEDPDALLHDDVDLEVRRAGGGWTGLEADGDLHPMGGGSLAPSATARIQVRAVFRPSSPNRSQTSSLRLRFTVALAQDATVSPPDDGTGPGLPDTGGVRGGLLAIGFALMAAGVLLVRRGVRPDGLPPDKENP